MNITITFNPPLSDLAARWRRLASTGLYESIGRIVPDVADIVLGGLQDEAPVSPGIDPRRTPGQLRDSIHPVQLAHYGGGVTVEFRAVDSAKYVVGGTAPHEIEASGRALMWYGADGEMHFAKRVQHPGTQPNPFPERAWANVQDEVVGMLADRLGSEIAEQVA